MRLTDKERWTYPKDPISRREIDTIIARDEWLRVTKATLPNRAMDLFELGCAPGNFSAALCIDRPWSPYGIDYSDDAELYLRTMQQFGMKATLYEADIFEYKIDRDFDVVCSFGLIEHFRGSTLDRVLEMHDRYLRSGGYLVITVPNFTGLQYFWHYLFDRPDLDKHNVDVMQLETFKYFRDRGYNTLYLDFVGVMRLWGNSGWVGNWFLGKSVAAGAKGISALARLAAKLGLRLSGRAFAPYILYIAQKSGSG